MKRLIFLIASIWLICVSCDGRKSKSESLKASIAEFNQKQSNKENVTFYPKEYTEVVTDTLIGTSFRVHIKNYSLPNQSIAMLTNEVTNNLKLHRVFESEIAVTTTTKTILNTHISAEQFKARSKDAFWNNATLQQVWVNQELSTLDKIQLDVSFINPEEKSFKLYRMSIDGNGQQQLTLIEES